MNPADIYQVLADLHATSVGEVEALGAVLLALPPDQHSRVACRSSLNNDGSPLQLCMTSSSRGCSGRLIGDPGAFVSTINQRIERSRHAVRSLGAASGCASFDSLTNRLLRMIVPENCVQVAEPDAGIMWLATGMYEHSAAAYINARWGSALEDWARARFCLRSILPNPSDAESLINDLEPKARLASIGIETTSSDDVRLKVYWRLTAPTLLSSLAIPLLHHPTMHRFLATVVSNGRMSLAGLVFSAGFLLSTGELEDVKVDLCAHCLPMPLNHWLDRVDEVMEQNCLPAMPMRTCLRGTGLEPAFLGMGLNRNNQVRINLYLKSADAQPN
jgi:hypothetical protein